MATDINTGDIIGKFRVTSVTPLYEQNETAVMLTHEPTRLRWLHFIADDPVSSCAIAVVTPVADNRGLPHVLEHMVFEGSKRRPGTDLMRGMLNRTVAEDMNGSTSPFMTNYHFSSAVESDMRGIFEVWFDAILRPELSEAAFLREVGRFLPQDASNPQGPLTYTGVVFNEMCGKERDLPDRIINEARRHLVPDNGFGFAAGGRPSEIMSLSVDDVRAYHARWYCPANMRVATRGRELPRALLVLADKLLEGVAAGEAAPPFMPQPRWGKARSATIEITAPETSYSGSQEKMPNQGILWLLPDASDFRASVAVDLFSSGAGLGAAMDDAADKTKEIVKPNANFTILSDHLGPNEVFGIHGVFAPDTPAETLWDKTERVLRRLLDDYKTAVRIASTARTCAEQAAKTINEGGLADLARKEGFKALFRNWILRDDPFFGLASSLHVAVCHQFARDPGSAVAIVRDLLLDNPHRLDLSIREVRVGEDSESAAIALALADRRKALSDEDCRALAAREWELSASLAAAPSAEPLPETTLDDIPDDRLSIQCDEREVAVCGAKFLTVKSTATGEAWLAGFADLSDFTSEQLLMIPLIDKVFRDHVRRDSNLSGNCHFIDISPYACTGILDGVQRRGLKFMAKIDDENLKSVAEQFSCLFQLRDPLSYKKARSMMARGANGVNASQTYLHDEVWATADTAEASLFNACAMCDALGKVIAYRTSCARLDSQRKLDELAGGFVREASETADMLHNPARWTFALCGPEHLTAPMRDAILATLLSAPARPIGPVAELKFAPRRRREEKREAQSMPGCKVATISVSIPAPADTTLSRRHLEIGAKLLERDFAEPRIRKSLGAYGAQFSWRNNSLRLASFQNPDIGDTLGLVRSIRDFVAKVEWTAGDVRQATLTIASRFVNRSQSPYGIASQCLDESIEGRNPAHIREGLKTIAEMKPDDIKETLLEALDAGMGSETIRVEASEEAIAEANSHLPEGLKLHITGA